MLWRPFSLFLLGAVWWWGSIPALTAELTVQTFILEIHQRQVTGGRDTIQVKQGDRVTLQWLTDETVEIHLHGYDIEKVLQPGIPAEMTFEAYATGRYPITAHGFGGHSSETRHGETPLVYLEVLPR